MRTTLTIDNKTDLILRHIAKTQKMSYKEVINKALEEGVKALEIHEPPVSFKVTPKEYGFTPGVDQAKLNQLNDELEAEEL